MIEETGTITAVDKDHIWVETELKTTCGNCAVNNDCATSTIAKAFAPKKSLFIMRCHQPATVGQQVKLGIPEKNLIKASALMYLLPLIVLIVVAGLASWLLPLLGVSSELAVIAVSGLATVICFVWLKAYLHDEAREDGQYYPRLLSMVPLNQSQIEVKQMSTQPSHR